MIDQFNRNQVKIRSSRQSGVGMPAVQLAIVIQTRRGKAVLLAKCLTRQATLFILKCQAKRLTAAPTMTCMMAETLHDPSQSPRPASRKKVVAGTATIRMVTMRWL